MNEPCEGLLKFGQVALKRREYSHEHIALENNRMNLFSCSISELHKKCSNGQRLYCFGAGKILLRFLKQYMEYHLEDFIKGVADNSAEKVGQVVQVSEKDIPVIGVPDMLNDISTEDILVITTVKYNEILCQLEQYEQMTDISVAVYHYLELEQTDYARLTIPCPKLSEPRIAQKIPKMIHYCWFGKGSIPRQYREWMESWKRYCPDYEVIEWNEDNYDVHKNRYISQAYELGKWAYVSDYARIDIIHELGGVYLDTDVELIKNLDAFLSDEAFCCFEQNEYVAFGLGFGAVKGNPIIKAIRDYYDNESFVLADGSVNQVTCPVIQTKIMDQFGLVKNGQFQYVDGMAVYPSQMLCGMSPFTFRIQKDLTNTYAIHHFAASWLDKPVWDNEMIKKLKECSESEYYS